MDEFMALQAIQLKEFQAAQVQAANVAHALNVTSVQSTLPVELDHESTNQVRTTLILSRGWADEGTR